MGVLRGGGRRGGDGRRQCSRIPRCFVLVIVRSNYGDERGGVRVCMLESTMRINRYGANASVNIQTPLQGERKTRAEREKNNNKRMEET